jgi:hypothetical protein
MFRARSLKEDLNKVICSRRALALCLAPGLPKAPAEEARRAGGGLGVLPGGAPAPLGAFSGKGAWARGGGEGASRPYLWEVAAPVLRAADRSGSDLSLF